MSIPKKGSRKIVVDGEEYIWLIRSKPTYTQECQEGLMHAAIELNQKQTSVLSITFSFQRPDSLVSNETNAITPSVIRSCIHGAIRKGWQPNKKGSAFQYNYES